MLNHIRNLFVKLRRDERGATLVEYGIALLIAIGVGGTILNQLADSTEDQFECADDIMEGVSGSTNC